MGDRRTWLYFPFCIFSLVGERLIYYLPSLHLGINLVNFKIENIIASTNLNQKLDLEDTAEKLENSEYNPGNFPGVIWRPPTQYGVALLFEDGRVMCTNTRSNEEVDELLGRLIKKLETLGILTPRASCPSCGAVVDAEDVVCIECGTLLQQ